MGGGEGDGVGEAGKEGGLTLVIRAYTCSIAPSIIILLLLPRAHAQGVK